MMPDSEEIFKETYEDEFKEKFENEGLTYFFTLIDDAVSRIIKSGEECSGQQKL